jgi:hypothetical protein
MHEYMRAKIHYVAQPENETDKNEGSIYCLWLI